MSKVRAKFTCNAVVPNEFGGGITAHFNAVYSDNGENASYSKSTPNGNLTIMIDDSTPAVTFFERGKNYYLDFSEAPSE